MRKKLIILFILIGDISFAELNKRKYNKLSDLENSEMYCVSKDVAVSLNII